MTDKTHTDGPTVVQALAAVAEDVRQVRKADKNEHAKYLFRGIDAVMNAVGPALRAHGVVVMPETLELQQSVVQTTSGKPQTSSRVQVRYRFHGPAGDHLDAVVWGESWDGSDKGLAQAYSVAYRTCLLQALTIPTDDPDPDSKPHEQRAVEPGITPAQKGEINALLDLFDPNYQAMKETFKEWWADQGFPSLRSGQLTERQAAVIIAHLESLDIRPSVEQPTTPEGSEGGEATGETVEVPAVQAAVGEPAGSTHPGGPPSRAAREALEKAAGK